MLHAAAAQDMNAAIDKAVQKYATVKTARGSIRQTNKTTLGHTFNLVGDFQQQFPNLLSIRYSDPKGDALVSDGKFTWLYSPTSEPGIVHRSPGTGVNLIGVFLDSPRTKYTLSDSGKQNIDGHATHAVGLVPKQPIQEFRRATVWIEDDGTIRQFEFQDATGTIRKINFSTLQLNAPVDAAQFKFVPPRGTKVVDG
jgi:outer membrane lipoprotein carrier protein